VTEGRIDVSKACAPRRSNKALALRTMAAGLDSWTVGHLDIRCGIAIPYCAACQPHAQLFSVLVVCQMMFEDLRCRLTDKQVSIRGRVLYGGPPQTPGLAALDEKRLRARQ
jgi:hypothetical protein